MSLLGPWATEAIERIERVPDEARFSLADDLRASLTRVAHANGGTSLATALTSPAATPFLRALQAYFQDAGVALDGPFAADIGEATLALYLHVRVADDMVDEPRLVLPRSVFALDVWSARSVEAFARALPAHPEFFAFRREILGDFLETAAHELGLRKRQRALPLERLGEKFLPLAVPLGAVAIGTGSGASLPLVRKLVVCLGQGLQLVNDALNVSEDHAARRPSLVLTWLREARLIDGSTDARTLPARLAASEVVDRVVAVAQTAVFAALDTALALNAPRLAALASERAAFVHDLRARLLALALGGRVL